MHVVCVVTADIHLCLCRQCVCEVCTRVVRVDGPCICVVGVDAPSISVLRMDVQLLCQGGRVIGLSYDFTVDAYIKCVVTMDAHCMCCHGGCAL